ncbi:uncharacterized protein LOC106660459 [Trichogramma pretiosum]|uniref:uncharacterized protein LOC106660459 n=1 Tax=Trichogramma pretiosum TaxID=7493 RepID=UPI0006C9C073|nr:uncharacterized protein LOC106660459 [Trichogramma pretiosum]
MKLLCIFFLLALSYSTHAWEFSSIFGSAWNSTKGAVSSAYEATTTKLANAYNEVLSWGHEKGLQLQQKVNDWEAAGVDRISKKLDEYLYAAEKKLSPAFDFAAKNNIDVSQCQNKSETDLHQGVQQILDNATSEIKDYFQGVKDEASEAVNGVGDAYGDAKKKEWSSAASDLFNTGKSGLELFIDGESSPGFVKNLLRHVELQAKKLSKDTVRAAEKCVIETVKKADPDAEIDFPTSSDDSPSANQV